MAADCADHGGTGDLRGPSDSGRVLLPVDDQASEQERRHRLQVGAIRRYPLAADVLQALPHLPGDAAALEALHGRVVAKHRGLESHQLQHQICSQDPDDHLPGHRAAGLHGLPMDYRLVDAASV